MWRERMSLCCEEWNEAEWECCMAGAETPGVGVGGRQNQPEQSHKGTVNFGGGGEWLGSAMEEQIKK